MDVIDIPKLNVSYRVLYDVKGRWVFVKLDKKTKGFKLCRIQKKTIGANKVCYLVTHDGRTLRFVNPDVCINDTVKLNLDKNEVVDFYQMKVGNLVYVMNGNNRGRVGVVQHINKFDGQHDLISIKDNKGRQFSTRVEFVMAIGTGNKSVIKLPKGQGIRKTIMEETADRLAKN